MAERDRRVRMRTLSAGPAGVLQPGTEYALPGAFARALTEAGAAEDLGIVGGAPKRGRARRADAGDLVDQAENKET